MPLARIKKSSFLRTAKCLVLLLAVEGTPAGARKDDKPVQTPPIVSAVVACRTLSDPVARLTCYDERVKAFADATTQRQIVVVDENEVRSARRGLFGFSLPKLKLFGSDDGGEDLKRLDAVITNVRHARDGSWIISLSEGGDWLQTDLRPLALSPKVGNKVVVTRGALGAYFVGIHGQPAIKMSRIH